MTNNKHLLIVYHTKTGNTGRLAEAVISGANDPLFTTFDVVSKRAQDSGPTDLLWANALLLGTPENFGYMSGAMKDFLDRTFYEVEGQIQPLPYSVFISAGNDGSGALRAIRRIANGYPFTEVQEPLIVKGQIRTTDLNNAMELGMSIAAGLDAGIY